MMAKTFSGLKTALLKALFYRLVEAVEKPLKMLY